MEPCHLEKTKRDVRAIAKAVRQAKLKAPPAPCDVRIVRVSRSRLDTDNLQGSAKHVRDAVARWLGVDDRDPRVTWHVGQESGATAVRIVVRPWSLDAVGARSTVEGETVRVEAVLTASQRTALARQLLDHPEVDVALAGFRLTLHTATTRTP